MNTLLFEIKEHIAIITFNRPEQLNVLNTETLNELFSTLTEIEKDREIRAVILTGSGKAFVAGADIKEMSAKTPKQAKEFALFGQKVFSFMEQMPQPILACLNGFALGGGCELACACDLRTASTKVKIGEPEVNLGIVPGFGGSVRLPRLIGLSQAKKMILTGDALSAQEAEQIGLIHWVFEPEELFEKTFKIAQRFARKSLTALGTIKQQLRHSLELEFTQAEKYEAKVFSDCFTTHDQKEGMQAFLEKRDPKFEGL